MSISRIKVLSRNTLKLMYTTLSYTAPQASTNIIHPRRTRIFSCLKTSHAYSKANCFTFRVVRLCAVSDQRIKTLTNAHSLRVWGCYGPGELDTRFSAVCRREGHVIIKKDKYFDFVDVEDVKKIVTLYVNDVLCEKDINIVDPHTRLLSEWAVLFGATYEIEDTSALDEPYILKIKTDSNI